MQAQSTVFDLSFSAFPDQTEHSYCMEFVCGGIEWLIGRWIEDGMSMPVPEMAALIMRLLEGFG
jgi:hypothetical protein